MTKDKDKPMEVVLTDQVLEQMAADPELAKAVEQFKKIVAEADALVKSGQFDNIDDAMASLGHVSELIDPDELSDEAREAIDNAKVSPRN